MSNKKTTTTDAAVAANQNAETTQPVTTQPAATQPVVNQQPVTTIPAVHEELATADSAPAIPVNEVDPEVLLKAVNSSEELEAMASVMTLTADYIELRNVGESFRGVYIGTGTINVKDKATGSLKQIRAARFVVARQVRINAGTVLVNEIDRAGIPAGTPIEVRYSGDAGNAKLYTISLLA
jgi:hypothetical protein